MKKYKSLLALVLCLMMLFVLTGCTKSMTYSKARNHLLKYMSWNQLQDSYMVTKLPYQAEYRKVM